MNKNNILISLCMIAKNEEENIERALISSWRLVDEIIVVDTGSQDNTVKIALSFGAKVYYKKWQDDFSVIKNFALEKASGRWILFLDADEEIRGAEREKLHVKLRKAEEIGFYISIINLSDSENSIKSKGIRLFRNISSFRYQGKIHEEIITSIQTALRLPLLGKMDFTIYHYGYLKNEVEKRNKIDRNLRILKQEKNMDSSRYCLYLGMEYLRGRQLHEAEKWFKKGLKQSLENSDYKHLLFIKLIKCLFSLKKYEEGIYFCQQGLALYSDFADLYFYWGVLLLKQRNYQQAKLIFLRGLEQGVSSSQYISEMGCGSYQNYFFLGFLEETCLNIQKAGGYYYKAFKLQPENKKFLQAFLRMGLVSNKSIFELLESINSVSSLAFLDSIEMLYELGSFRNLKLLADKYRGVLNSPKASFVIAALVLAEENLQLANIENIKKLDEIERDIMLFAWLIALIKEENLLQEHFCIRDKEVLWLLTNIRCFYYEGKLEDMNFRLDSINKINAFLKLLEAAAFINNNVLLQKIISFISVTESSDLLPLAAKIIYKQGREYEARNLLRDFSYDYLDTESSVFFAALLVRNENLKAVMLGKYLLKKGELNCRVFLTSLEACIQEGIDNCSKLKENSSFFHEIPKIL